MSAAIWNSKNKVGDKFIYQSVKGVTPLVDVVTRSEAWDLGHGDTVVKVTGVTGGVCVGHLVKENK